MKKNFITYLNFLATEGGMSRNFAFYKKIESHSEVLNVYSKGALQRIVQILRGIIHILYLKDKEVFLHQGAMLAVFPTRLLRFSFFSSFLLFLLKRLEGKNRLTIEINDLPYEQSKDLGFPVKKEDQIFQQILYSLEDTHYIFASELMRNYAVKTYGMVSKNTEVIINGAPRLSSVDSPNLPFENDNRIKYVYCGTLNKGRDIEELLLIFSRHQDKVLVLLGPHGEWLKENNLLALGNVFYLGSYPEAEAHYIVSRCDVGLLHYDENKLYYNICYPTKASFYVTAGVAVLCTPLQEMRQHFQDLFFFSPFKDFSQKINSISREEILQQKSKIEGIKEKYYWDVLLEKCKF